ncbi:MAG: hypothetical protein PHU54_08470 [Candidatus Omnitrophica bacterium]|nr:hypothetical protein [Candidatus Omnitrophota bacterium]
MNQPQVIWSRVLASACPVCGSKKRVSHKVFEKQIKEKKIKEADTFLSVSGKMADQPLGLSAEIITVYDDICLECGAHYTIKFEKVKTLVTGQIPGSNGKMFPGQGGLPLS